MVSVITMSRIPISWLQTKVLGNRLHIDDDSENVKVTELHANVFSQLSSNVTEIELCTHVTSIQPGAFAGLEGIRLLEFMK